MSDRINSRSGRASSIGERRAPRACTWAVASFLGLVAATALGTLSACAGGNGRAPASSGRIVVLGDSLSVSPSDSVNFAAILESSLKDRGLAWRVINAGVRGDTTAGGLRRVDAVLAANRPDILILALGANDGLRGVDVKLIASNLTSLIERARAGGSRVLLCGMQLPPISLLSYGRAFRGVFESVAEAEDVAFVPFLLEGVAMDAKMNGADGIHPNADGAKQIAETIWPYLDELIRQ